MRRARKSWTLEQRLEERSIPEPNSGCLLWMGDADNRYGKLHVRGETLRVHRVAYEIANGPIPDGMNVCHKCDVPFCINPNHLFLGTDNDNVSDRVSKGRSAKGEVHGRARLTEAQVLAIINDPQSMRKTALRFGVSRSAISHIRSGRNWRHLRKEPPVAVIAR